jgi:catechol 2,3-dioxygenase-like lactoylglutathione lyase family enzyme
MIGKLSGTTIFTDDAEKLAAFYRDVVGLPLNPNTGPDPTSGETFYVFGPQEGPYLGVGKHSEVSGKTAEPARHISGLDTDDIKADFERLKAAGVEFIEEPNSAGDNLQIATFKDPDGNYIQLFQFSQVFQSG